MCFKTHAHYHLTRIVSPFVCINQVSPPVRVHRQAKAAAAWRGAVRRVKSLRRQCNNNNGSGSNGNNFDEKKKMKNKSCKQTFHPYNWPRHCMTLKPRQAVSVHQRDSSANNCLQASLLHDGAVATGPQLGAAQGLQ